MQNEIRSGRLVEVLSYSDAVRFAHPAAQRTRGREPTAA